MAQSEQTFQHAFKQLTGFELIGVQVHYGCDMEQLGGLRSLLGAIWAQENRTAGRPAGSPEAKAAWKTVEALTLDEIQSYFAPEDPDPESEQGKEGSSTEGRPADSPTSA